MVSLCQFVAARHRSVGRLAARLRDRSAVPRLVILAGVITGVIGTLIGLPALRLSGLYLALITLMAAGGISVVLRIAQFPNGGDGFFGNSAAGGATSRLPRPALATGDTAYYRYCVVVAAVMFLLAVWHVRGKPGRAWAAIRQSQATAVAAGVNTTFYKLWAFALASFIAGVAGAMLAAATGGVNINQFPVQNSITLLAVVLMGGIYSIWGAVVAAFLLRLLPALLDDWGVSDRAAHDPVRHRRPAGADDRARWLGRPGAEGPRQARPADPRDSVVIEVVDLSVRFGGVLPIDQMTVTFAHGTCGLIGPNGAGKTTFFNVLSGFVRPYAGRVQAFGDDLLAIADFRRPLGPAPHLPDRAGDPRPLRLRQRRPRARAHRRRPPLHARRGDAGGRLRRADARRRPVGRGSRCRPPTTRRDRPRRGGPTAAGAARRTSGRPAGRGDRPPRRADPPDPRRDGRAGHPRRPRHEPRAARRDSTAVLDFGRLIAS